MMYAAGWQLSITHISLHGCFVLVNMASMILLYLAQEISLLPGEACVKDKFDGSLTPQAGKRA